MSLHSHEHYCPSCAVSWDCPVSAPAPEACPECGGLSIGVAELRARLLEAGAAIDLALDWSDISTPAFVAKYGPGMTSRQRGDILRAALACLSAPAGAGLEV